MFSKVVFIGLVWPEPDTTAAGSRILQLIHFFLDRSSEVHFASTAQLTEYSYPLEDLGVLTHRIELNDRSFDNWITTLDPEIVVFDRFVTEEQFSWRVREKCPMALRILDSEDLHFLRDSRRKSVLNKNASQNLVELSQLALRELASIFRSDLTLIISEFEMDLLTEKFKLPAETLHYLPFYLDQTEQLNRETFPAFSDRVDFMTIGNWKHLPNKDSVQLLKKEIWPQIRKGIPGANLHIYGAYGPGEKSGFHDPENGFLIEGWKDSKLEAFSRHRVCLAPLRFGAGLKGKLFDALRFGTPSVTTSLGAEGISDARNWNGFVCDQPGDFINAAIELYSKEKVWKEAQLRGEQILRDRFSSDQLIVEFQDRLSRIMKDLESCRIENITGALLWHHSAQSTKYLSKWIEAKNQNQNPEV
jgi:glycosyltransferase involved in cell wall biosynthesis